MKKQVLSLVALAALTVTPCAVRAQTSLDKIGVGPHGNDYLIGTWSCTNSAPSALSGPSSVTETVVRGSVAGTLAVHASGKGFDGTGYVVYVAKTKTWWNPFAFADGSYEDESSTGTGAKLVFAGPYFNAATGQTTKIRDTYTTSSFTKQVDVGESQSGGAWKKQYTIVCTKD
jgi:hypothetical protein